MTFISYAHNLEDVMLWRAFCNLDRGFYIDICPDSHINGHSLGGVTRSFYQMGWTGLNVISDLTAFQALANERPRDILLNRVIGFPSSSSVDSLASVWSTNISNNQAVHFLSIQAHTTVNHILSGNDWTRFRPWVVLVSSSFVRDVSEPREDWESLLVGHHYQFAFTNGLSRFYVAEEHVELLKHFEYPPNVLDDFITEPHFSVKSALKEATLRLRAMETSYQEILQKSIEAKSMSDWAQGELIGCQAQLQGAHNSLSWRITSPVRRLQSFMRRLFGADWKSRLKSSIKKPILLLGRQVLSRPKFKALAVRLVTRLGLYDRFKSYLSGRSFIDGLGPNQPNAPNRYWISTARSRRVRDDLNAEIETIKKEMT